MVLLRCIKVLLPVNIYECIMYMVMGFLLLEAQVMGSSSTGGPAGTSVASGKPEKPTGPVKPVGSQKNQWDQ